MGFDPCTSLAARRRRKRKYPRKFFRSGSQRETEKKERLTEAKAIFNRASTAFRKKENSGGSNNSIRLASLIQILNTMNAAKKITRTSHVIDFGSGNGAALAFVSKRYGCKVTGIEFDRDLHEIAKKTFMKEKLQGCNFICEDLKHIEADWLKKNKATHVYTYDGVFNSEPWNNLFDVIKEGPEGMVGASCSKWRCHWPEEIEPVDDFDPVQAKLNGSKSSFAIRVWKRKKL